MMGRNEPLGLPKGSVRSILVLSFALTVDLVAIIVAVRVLFLLTAESIDTLVQLFILVFTAVVSLANLGAGYYFGTRATAAATDTNGG